MKTVKGEIIALEKRINDLDSVVAGGFKVSILFEKVMTEYIRGTKKKIAALESRIKELEFNSPSHTGHQ
jgi:hypothetical protein